MIAFVFDGGVLERRDALRPLADELADLAFVPVRDLADRASPRLTRRVTGALDARATGATVYLEHGRPV